MKSLFVALMLLTGISAAKAQNVKVDVNPNIQVDVQSIVDNVVASINEEFDFDFAPNLNIQSGKGDYQEATQEIEIPLSKPGERGSIEVDSRNGKVKITGYDGPTVKVKIIKYEKKVSGDSKNGMRLISSGGFSFQASENNNRVKVENEGWNDRADFEIMVPKNFNVKADTYNNGTIIVEGVNGEVNVESYNGPITLTGISGSASASTYNGAIEVTFNKVTADAPMAFSTYNGNIDISVPDGTKFSTKMKTKRDIFTDFEAFKLKQTQPV
ncbi:MAG TPA: hypothetical protein VIN11_04900, partial [Roseivirga sp.]